MHLSDRVTGLFLIALGGAAAYAGSRLPPVPGQQIGPNVFPMVVGGGLGLCGALIALRVGRRFEEEAEAELAAHADTGAHTGAGAGTDKAAADVAAPVELARWWRGLAALVPPGLLVFYVLAVERLGFVATAAALVLVAAVALGARLRLAVPLALVAPVLVHLIFSKLLRVPLPEGLIALPW